MMSKNNTITAVVLYCMALCSFGQASTLTHGPMIGHTTDTTTRIWVRAFFQGQEDCFRNDSLNEGEQLLRQRGSKGAFAQNHL
ncbi:MAG: hypothetical protein ACYS17_01020 [Planctomycetota bacterium]